MAIKCCVFGGPTLYRRRCHGLTVYPPARLGSAHWAWKNGYRSIAIIDGYFGSIPSIWHKELLFVISQGVAVWGAASMGALRAAELSRYGMGGLGKVFRLYQAGILTDDDEVCVTHAPRYLRYRPLTEALVNVRVSLREVRRRGVLTRQQESALIDMFKELHFSKRSRDSLLSCMRKVVGLKDLDATWDAYCRFSKDQKGLDAERLLARLAAGSLPQTVVADWEFPTTLHWRRQFVERIADLPAGDTDPIL